MTRLLPTLLFLLPLAGPGLAQQCSSLETDLIAGQTIDVGRVIVENTPTELHIRVSADRPWFIEAVHIYAGPGPLPTNSGGNVAPGQFPFKTDYNPPVALHEEVISLAQIAMQCGDTALVAVHCEMALYNCQGQKIQEETAWAFGNPFSGNQWGWSLDFDLCCTGCEMTGSLDLAVDPLHPGMPAGLTATGAPAGQLVRFFGGCGRTVCTDGRLDLVGTVDTLGTVAADPSGLAAITIQVPSTALVGRVFSFQAAYQEVVAGVPVLRKSMPVLARILP